MKDLSADPDRPATAFANPWLQLAIVFVLVAAGIAMAQGWGVVFAIAMSFNLLAAFLALVVLKPLRARHFAALRCSISVSAGVRPAASK